MFLDRVRGPGLPEMRTGGASSFAHPIVAGTRAAACRVSCAVPLSCLPMARLAEGARAGCTGCSRDSPCAHRVPTRTARARQRRRRPDVTDQERQKTEELISRLEVSVGQIFPRDGGNAALLATMIQTLNGLRSLLGLVRPH